MKCQCGNPIYSGNAVCGYCMATAQLENATAEIRAEIDRRRREMIRANLSALAKADGAQ